MPKTDVEDLLRESPYSMPHRPLVDEPLTAEDWGEVHRGYRAFVVLCRMIVVRARARVSTSHD